VAAPLLVEALLRVPSVAVDVRLQSVDELFQELREPAALPTDINPFHMLI
jgi:hypothetical protein